MGYFKASMHSKSTVSVNKFLKPNAILVFGFMTIIAADCYYLLYSLL